VVQAAHPFNSFPVATSEHRTRTGCSASWSSLSILSQLQPQGLDGYAQLADVLFQFFPSCNRGGAASRPPPSPTPSGFQFFPSCNRVLGNLLSYKPFLREPRSS
jgi:hypothetical protein